MKTPVIAIGLDAADPELMNRWLAEGRLPNLAALRAAGGYGSLDNLHYYKAETPWTTFLTGVMPAKTGYWTPVKFREGSYRVEEVQAYDFAEYPPFYALGEDFRVAVFDVPQTTLTPQANGPQVLAWGAHSPQTRSHSLPTALHAEVIARYGEHPALHHDHGAWWDKDYLHFLRDATSAGIERRTRICVDWLRQERWDLFLTIFGETHSLGHDFWYLSQPDGPLSPLRKRMEFDGDPLLEAFQEVDEAIGAIIAAAPPEATIVVFSIHGSGHNTTDLPSMVLLPEFLYRHSNPGRTLLAPGKAGARLGAPISHFRGKQWEHEIWELRRDSHPLQGLLKRLLPRRVHRRINRWFNGSADRELLSQKQLRQQGQAVTWQPSMWYSGLWPKMRAFAIPSFSEGYIRINLAGREPEGMVQPEDYDALCEELTTQLHRLVNPRNGKPVVKEVVRTRTSAQERDPKLPEADLVVIWAEEPADVIEHPRLGRIGPVPYRRSGSHRARGFWIARGPGIDAGTVFQPGHAVDLPATLLALMHAPLPPYMDGKPLLKHGDQDAGPAPVDELGARRASMSGHA
jgi:predicted AlkP superfamily phosphohydrolase/phosphomutase